MESLSSLLYGFGIALTPINLFYCFLGALMGTLVGVLPGLGPSATLALLLPVTFKMNPVSAFIMFAGICYGAMYGGSTTSILLNIPGEPASIVTCLDGYQMARKGRAGPALGISAFGSFIAGTIGIFGLVLMAPPLAKLALRFGPPEYFTLLVFVLSLATYLSKLSMVKSLMMVALGIMIGCVGLDPIFSKARFTFGILNLADGISFPAIAMGMLGVTEVLESISHMTEASVLMDKIKGLFPTKEDWKRSLAPIMRGTFLGFFLGIIPGMGGIVPTFLSYALEKRISKHPERFGTGEVEGVAAPEASNNAALEATFIPLMSLGVPSNAMTSVLLGALLIYGVQPGPLLITTNPDLFWGVVASMYIGNCMLLVLNLPLIPIWVRLLKIPYSYLFSLILLLCLIGAYSLSNSTFDVLVMIIFGVVAYILKRFSFEVIPLIMAIILGPMVEIALRRSLIMSSGSLAVFLTRPLAAAFLIGTLLVLVLPLLKRKRLGEGIDRKE